MWRLCQQCLQPGAECWVRAGDCSAGGKAGQGSRRLVEALPSKGGSTGRATRKGVVCKLRDSCIWSENPALCQPMLSRFSSCPQTGHPGAPHKQTHPGPAPLFSRATLNSCGAVCADEYTNGRLQRISISHSEHNCLRVCLQHLSLQEIERPALHPSYPGPHSTRAGPFAPTSTPTAGCGRYGTRTLSRTAGLAAPPVAL